MLKIRSRVSEMLGGDLPILQAPMGWIARALRTEHSEQLQRDGANAMQELTRVLDLYFGGDMQASIALSGQVAGRIGEVLPVARILRETAEEFLAVAASLGRHAASES